MVKNSVPKRLRPKKNKYFFLDKELHKVLTALAPANLLEAWNYPQHKRVTMLYSDYSSLTQRAVKTAEAAKIINVKPLTMYRAIEAGGIRQPCKTYKISNPDAEWNRRYYWGLHNLLELHDYLMTVHVGRPRKDGAIVPNQRITSKAAIIAAMTDEKILYVKGEGNIYVPVYEPPTF
jgi:hypothetical protein